MRNSGPYPLELNHSGDPARHAAHPNARNLDSAAMDRGRHFDHTRGLLDVEDCVDARGEIALPPGTTLVSLIERNVAGVGDTVATEFPGFRPFRGFRRGDHLGTTRRSDAQRLLQ